MKLAGLAVSLAQRKLLTQEDCGAGLDSGVKIAISRWLDKMFSGLEFFKFTARIYSDVFEACQTSREDFVREDNELRITRAFDDACGVDINSNHIAVGLYAAENNWVLIGDGIEKLELRQVGLGWAVLREIEVACRHFNLFDFSWLERAASYTYWGGGEDENEMLEEYGESKDEYEGITRSDFEAEIPLGEKNKAKRLTTSLISELAKHGEGEIKEIADLVCRLRRLRNMPEMCRISSVDSEFDWFDSLEPTVLLGWKSWGIVQRLADDYSEIMYNGDSDIRYLTAVLPIPLADGKALAKFELRWRGALKRLRYADKLLGMIATRGE